MKNNIDLEKIKQILEKIERGEKLNKSEKIYLDIIKILKKKKSEKVKISPDFQENLKAELLAKYDKLYNKKGLYYRISTLFQIPLLRFVISFCFVFIFIFGIYSGFNSSHKGGIEFGSKSQISPALENTLPQTSKEEEYTEVHSTLDDISESKDYSKGAGGLQFGGDRGVISSGLKGSSESSDKFIWLVENSPLILILLLSIIISFIFVLKRKKK